MKNLFGVGHLKVPKIELTFLGESTQRYLIDCDGEFYAAFQMVRFFNLLFYKTGKYK